MVGRVFLHKYKAIQLLGQGGMGQVYLAQDLGADRQVVVKVLHPHLVANHKFREVFRREIDCMVRFQHPHAVALYEAALDDPDGPCLAMEYVRGVALDELLQRHGHLSPQRVGRLTGQLCAVLQAAHAQGIIHRDLKPANIMVAEPDTSEEKIKVMDFGLAKLAAPSFPSAEADGGESGGSTLYIPVEKLHASNASLGAGTPQYVCPEQIRGDEADHRGDIYSVGVLLYELLTGRRPFEASTLQDLITAHLYQSPPSFASIEGSDWVPPALETVVQACLAKYPQDRPQSALELAQRYEEALGQKIMADADTTASLPSPPTAPAPVAREPAAAQEPADTDAVIYDLEAWMPEQIAVVKLRGFLNEVGGQVVESLPGLIRVRLPRSRGVVRVPARGWLARLGLAPKFASREDFEWIDMEMAIKKEDPQQPNQLHIVVRLHPSQDDGDSAWDAWCERIQSGLSGYLMAKRWPCKPL